MPQNFTPPRIQKQRVSHRNFSLPQQSSQKRSAKNNVASWWDYLATCNNTTKTDRNTIYWKYKTVFDRGIEIHPCDILNTKYAQLPAEVQKIVNKIYLKEMR